MTRADFAIPGDLGLPTGGYAYDRAMLAALPDLRHLQLPEPDFAPDAAWLTDVGERLEGTGPLVVDGLALGVLPAELIRGLDRPVIALCHHPLGLETGLPATDAARLIASERAALSACDAVIVTSERTAHTLRTRFGVEAPQVVEPGLALIEAAPRSGAPAIIATLASFTPRKGHDVLLAALERISDLDWHAVWAGAEPDAEWSNHLDTLLSNSPVAHRVDRIGPMDNDAKEALLTGADLFCLTTHYEGYGMVFGEAMMAGLPIVATAGGAVADVVPPQAGHVVEPGDAEAVASRLRSLLTQPETAKRMAAAGRAHALTLPGWPGQAARFAAIIREAGQ